MEIYFDSRTQLIYKELCHQVKRVQECAESVVPDINDDIGKIASVQTAVFLKSKDVTSRGVVINGEATAALLYITENETAVSYVNLSKQFTLEYDVPDIDVDTIAHINLSVSNSEARTLNPRKVSVTFELCGELCCYKKSEIKTDTLLPDTEAAGLHAKYETRDVNFANSACEKTFSVNEQYAFPSGKPSTSRIVSETAEMIIADTQLIGTKAVLKGNVNICVCYLSSEVNYPLKAEFTSPFSQIIDIGTENMENCTAVIAVTSAYFDLTESINGDKMLDSEIHAVVQLVSRYKQTIKYVSDVYSNLMPVDCSIQNSQINVLSEIRHLKMTADERVSVADECMDVLSVFTSVSQVVVQQSKIAVAVTLDIVYRSKNGNLSAVRRLENLEDELESLPARLLGVRTADIYLRPDGAYIDAHMVIEAAYQTSIAIDLASVEGVITNSELSYDMAEYPTVTVVRAENETLWELAKAYHSSVEKIAAMNDISDGLSGKLLLIPKSE